jgi:hypothetical protein
MTAGHVSIRKIYSRDGLAPGDSETRSWNKPPRHTVVTYWAEARPPAASGPHGTSSGKVAITRVEHTYTKDNYNGDKWKSYITVKNTGSGVTGYDVWQSWVDLE